MRREFPASIRKAAWARAGGVCECGCGRAFGEHPKERPHYDHEMPDYLGGEPTLENCRVVRVDCHQAKTATQDLPRIKKVRREVKRKTGTGAAKRKIPGRRFNGDPIWK